MSLYRREERIGAESEGKRLQSMKNKKSRALVYREGKAKRKARRKMTHERLELTKKEIVCMAISREQKFLLKLTKQSQLKGIQS